MTLIGPPPIPSKVDKKARNRPTRKIKLKFLMCNDWIGSFKYKRTRAKEITVKIIWTSKTIS